MSQVQPVLKIREVEIQCSICGNNFILSFLETEKKIPRLLSRGDLLQRFRQTELIKAVIFLAKFHQVKVKSLSIGSVMNVTENDVCN